MSNSEHPGQEARDEAVPGGPAPAAGDGDAPAGPRELHVNWFYGLFALVLLSLAFGIWGTWIVFGAGPGEDPATLRQQLDELEQRVTTLARSDQISREANRDLQGALAEREEQVAGLRAEVAFYERFVGSTAERRGLTVHELQIRPGEGQVWHFSATLTQNRERGQASEGTLTLAIEGSRNGRLEELAWTDLRQNDDAPAVDYSFRYFQQVQGDIVLPEGFTPVRVTVRAAPARGSAVEQSFPWADATGRSTPGA
ncbi:DUF6776 family protein [Luteimonas dalianensis]|uniref:DUF6776 family protein n=1 Tax=Luteimonas dalianensis TaxID=1148196 RepID=UPI003BF23B36